MLTLRVRGDTREEDARWAPEFYAEVMYIALLNYTAPRNEVDYALPEHAEWMRSHFSHGLFLVS